jgi:hypothetical protein
MGRWRSMFGLMAGLTIGATALPARGEGPPDRAAAEALATAASVLMQKGFYREACAKYDESAKLDPGARRLLKLAECQERAGMTASAWLSLAEARDRAEAKGDDELAQIASQNGARLTTNVGRIAIVVPTAANIAGLEVRRDGMLVVESVRDLAVAVDPGPHVISATAPGRRPWSTQIGLASGGATVTVTIPNLETDREDFPFATDRTTAFTPPNSALLLDADGEIPRSRGPLDLDSGSTRPAMPPDTDRGSTQRTIGWVLGGAGLVSLGASAFFGLQASSTNDDLEARCPAHLCMSNTRELIDRAHSQAIASTVFLGLGLASLTGGAVVYLTAPSPTRPERQAASLRVVPAFAPGAPGLMAIGRF